MSLESRRPRNPLDVDSADSIAEYCESIRSQVEQNCADLLKEQLEDWIPCEEGGDNGWNLAKVIKDARIYTRRYRDSKFAQMKATKTVKSDLTAADLARFIYYAQDCLEIREFYEKHDPGNAYYDNVHRYSPTLSIGRVRTTADSFIVWDRDLVGGRLLVVDPDNPNEAYLIGGSLEWFLDKEEINENIPPDTNKSVRCYTRYGSHFVKNPETNDLTFTYYLHADPRGWIPSWLYNLVVYEKGSCASLYLEMFKRTFGESEESTEEDRLAGEVLTRIYGEMEEWGRTLALEAGGKTGEGAGVEEEGEFESYEDEGEGEEEEVVEIIEEVIEYVEEGEEGEYEEEYVEEDGEKE